MKAMGKGTYLFMCFMIDTRATFGVLAENSVVLWRIGLRWGSCVNLVELMMQCTPPASTRLVPVCLFRASSPWFFSPGTPAVTLAWPIRVQCTVRKLTLNPTSFLGVFWPYNGLGCQMLAWRASPRLWELSLLGLDPWYNNDSHDRKTIKPLRWLVWSESSLSTLILLLGWERGPVKKNNKKTETTPLREKRGKKKRKTKKKQQQQQRNTFQSHWINTCWNS